MKIYRTLFVFLFVFLFFVSAVKAASPQFFVSWEADTSAPSWFMGKKFPTYKSNVVVSFDLVSTNTADKGKIVDLSSREIRWYLNSDLVYKAKGATSLTIKNTSFPGSDIEVRISVEYVDRETNETYFADHRFTIPVKNSELVVREKNGRTAFSQGGSLEFIAYPFFFNVADQLLDMSWSLNGSKVAPDPLNPFMLIIQNQTNLQSRVSVEAAAQNRSSLLEQARTTVFVQSN